MLTSKWRFEKGDRKSYRGSSESELRTNLVKAKTDKSQAVSLCRVRRKVDESIDHIVSGCSKLAQNEYKRRHDNLGKMVYIGSLLDMNTSQKVFWRTNIIKSCGNEADWYYSKKRTSSEDSFTWNG